MSHLEYFALLIEFIQVNKLELISFADMIMYLKR